MRTSRLTLAVIASGIFLAAQTFLVLESNAQTAAMNQGVAALSGQVTSTEEGPMEGVLVSAKKKDSTITITVASDKSGHYRFPKTKLDSGSYSISMRAGGYDLDSPNTVEINVQNPPTDDL